MLMFLELLGDPPVHLLQRADRRKKFFDEDMVCRIPPQKKKERIREVMSWKAVLGGSCDKGFRDLVERCLTWDAMTRITPREALLHDWVLTGLPLTIRAQHVEQLTQDG